MSSAWFHGFAPVGCGGCVGIEWCGNHCILHWCWVCGCTVGSIGLVMHCNLYWVVLGIHIVGSIGVVW